MLNKVVWKPSCYMAQAGGDLRKVSGKRQISRSIRADASEEL